MLRAHSCFACAALVALFVASADAQRSIVLQRGPDLQRLAPFVGAWEGTLRRVMPSGAEIELEPSLRFDWAVGGVWLHGRDTTTLPNGDEIENHTWLTWRARDGAYHGAWQDNVFPGMVVFTGSWTDGGALVLDSGDIEVNGRPHRSVQSFRVDGDDTLTTELRMSWDDGPLDVVATGVFKRVR